MKNSSLAAVETLDSDTISFAESLSASGPSPAELLIEQNTEVSFFTGASVLPHPQLQNRRDCNSAV